MAVTIPYSQSFATDAWLTTFDVIDNSGSTTHNETGGFGGGGCADIEPPRTGDQGGGINGGGQGFSVTLSNLARKIHIRFLLKIGAAYRNNSESWDDENLVWVPGGLCKFIDVYDGSEVRQGILKHQVTMEGEDPRGQFMAFALQTAGAGYWYTSDPDDNWIQHAGLAGSGNIILDLNDGNEYVNQWLSVEYMIDKPNDRTECWIYTQSGQVANWNAPCLTTSASDITHFNISYYNSRVPAYGGDDHLYIDELAVNDSYIGPPDGFLSGTSKRTLFRK